MIREIKSNDKEKYKNCKNYITNISLRILNGNAENNYQLKK